MQMTAPLPGAEPSEAMVESEGESFMGAMGQLRMG